MGASTNRFCSLAEPLENRKLLSISPLQPAAMPIPVAADAVFFGPEIRFAAMAHFQNDGYATAWDHSDTEPAVVASAPSVADSTTGVMIVVPDNNSGTTSTAGQTFAGTACWDSPINAQEGDTDREALQTNLASLTNDNDIVDAADPATGADVATGADATSGVNAANTFAATAQNSSTVVSTNQVNVVRTSGTGGRAQPGILHPSPNESRGGSTGSDNGSSDGSDGSGSRGRSDNSAPVSASAIVAQTQGFSAGGAVSSAPNQTVIAGSAGKAASGLTQSIFSSVNLVMKPLASVTFSVLPLAIAEMTSSIPAVDSAGPSSAPQAFARAAGKDTVAALKAANAIIEAPAAPVRAALVNLFHVNALSTFSDAMGAFIDESSAKALSRGPTSHSRAWKVTAAAAAADLLLVGYWLSARRQSNAASRESPQAEQKLVERDSLPFCGAALSPR